MAFSGLIGADFGPLSITCTVSDLVVQLFNAVSKHQKEIKVKEAGQSEHKKAKSK